MLKLVFTVCILLSTQLLQAQPAATHSEADTAAPYKKDNTLPNFSIQTADSSWFVKQQLSDKKPTLILYFSPDCGHCQQETEELVSRMKWLRNLQVVMITSRSFEEMKNFSDYYKLERFPSIKIGRDPNRLVTQFYRVKFTPFSALYNKKGKLQKVYEKGIDWDELTTLVK